MLVLPLALLVAYGVLRMSNTLFAELRDLVFVRVTQRAIRRIALNVFRHLHALSLRFHLERQTGGMSRDIERGTRGISTLLSYMLFSIIPVVLEFTLVAAVLFAKFDWRFVAVTFGAILIYIAFTFAVTEWRIDIRRHANELDSRANTRANPSSCVSSRSALEAEMSTARTSSEPNARATPTGRLSTAAPSTYQRPRISRGGPSGTEA